MKVFKPILIPILITLAILFGYVRCWYQFCTSDFEASYKREIIYGVGCFTGLGVVIGYMNIHDTRDSDKQHS